MKNVTFEGPSAYLVIDGKRIARGETELLSNDAAARLEDNPRIDVTVEDEKHLSSASAAADEETKED